MIIKNSRIVVTGAAGGIGNVLTRQLLEQGAKLAIVDRDPEQLAVLASATNLESQGGLVITADLSSAT
ncbi:MAG: SDR family NAD(P)-dependent oxidoreductase, partial [Planctomycetia bacterium]|nr:SDR family NAD(P)-dependent oxidoreductase [Planctomycetia bacterium]